MTDFNTTTTADGIMLGVQGGATPEQLRAERAAQFAASNPPPAPPVESNQGRFTEADIERARREEKEKLYGRLEKVDAIENQLKLLQQERDAAAQAAQDAADAAEAARKEKEEESMTVRALLTKKDEEWTARFNQEQELRKQAEAVMDAERRFQANQQLKANLLQVHANDIVPQLADLVSGDTEEEIQQSVQEMINRSAAIMNEAAQAFGMQRQQQQGARITAPPVGPLEDQTVQRQLSAAEIAALSPTEYMKIRSQLMNAGRQQFYGR